MHEERGQLEGDVTVVEDFRLYGLVSGSVFVTQGCRFVLHGRVSGDVVVQPGATAELYGTVLGDVINAGGELQVLGRVQGRVRTQSGKTRISRDAVISEPSRDEAEGPLSYYISRGTSTG